MDLKRWLMALAVAALVIGPIGASTKAFAAGGKTAFAAPAYHEPDGYGENEGEEEGDEEGEGEGEGDGGLATSLEELISSILEAVGEGI